ncbi:MAG: hypothetical protein HYV97_07020 [Bdellovibrio sp.]|nr:hypothetical protein [Bdellovibrio sp.]
MKNLFMYLVLLSCGFIGANVTVAHDLANHPDHHVVAGDTVYKAPVHWNPPEYPLGTGFLAPTINHPSGYYPPVQPFKGPITPFNPEKTDIGNYDFSIMADQWHGQEYSQCNPNVEHACPGGHECVEENVDGNYLCPGRPSQVSVTDLDEIQCGSGSGITTKCGTGPQSTPCIADSRWRPNSKIFSTSTPWDDLAGGTGHWTPQDGPHRLCYFEHNCILSTHLSPRKLCKQDCMNACLGQVNPPSHQDCVNHCENQCNHSYIKTTCTYASPCLSSHTQARPSKTAQGQTISETFGCTDHYQCSSGLCLETDPGNGQPKVKACVPFAVCRRPCKKIGETLGGGDFCCLGLWDGGNGVCTDGTIFPSMPEEIEWTVDQASCQPNMYELRCATADCNPPQRVKVLSSIGSGSGTIAGADNIARYELVSKQDAPRGRERVAISTGSDDKTIVARSVWQFERFMYSAEWLWSQAGSPIFDESSNGGKANGYWLMHIKAKDLGKKMAELRKVVDNRYIKRLAEIEEDQQTLMSAQLGSGSGSGDTVGSTGNAASSIEYLKLMAKNHQALAELDAEKFGNYTILSALANGSGGLSEVHNHPSMLDTNDKYHTYGDYGEHGGPLYCEAWFPHCWFSTSLCGTRFDKNKVCVIERQKVNLDGVTNMLDPLYPMAILNLGGVNGQGQTIPTGVMIGAAVAVGMYNPVAGLAVLGVMALINYFKGWDIPVKREDWKNDKNKFVDGIYAHFQGYANQDLEGGNAAETAYNKAHKVHNISGMYQRDELKLLLLDLNIPEADFWSQLDCIEVSKSKDSAFDAKCKNLYPDWPLTTEKLHDLALKKSAESGVIHTLKYAAAGGSQYPTGGASYVKDYFGVMLDYLALYHQRAAEMHNEVAACLTRMAISVETPLAGGASVGQGSTNIATSAAPVIDTTIPTVSTPVACTGAACNSAIDQSNMNGINFGINGYNPGGVADGGGSFGTGDWNGRGSFGTGRMGGGTLNDTLMARRQKRLDARNRLSRGRKKGAHDDESGADRLRKDLAHINGAHAVFKTLKGGIYAGGSAGGMAGISAPIDPNAGKGSGSGSGNMDANLSDGHGGDGHDGEGATEGQRPSYAGNLFGDSYNGGGGAGGAGGTLGATATGLSQYDEDNLLRDSQKGKNEQIDPDADTIFKQISRAYMHYGVPRLLKKKK